MPQGQAQKNVSDQNLREPRFHLLRFKLSGQFLQLRNRFVGENPDRSIHRVGDSGKNQVHAFVVHFHFSDALLRRAETLLRSSFGKIGDAIDVADEGAIHQRLEFMNDFLVVGGPAAARRLEILRGGIGLRRLGCL